MALRVKTIEYMAWNPTLSGSTSLLAVATNRELSGATLIYIPETGITFKSVILQVDVSMDSATPASLTVPVISLKLGTSAYNSGTLVNPVVTSGEEEVWTLTRDVTNHMASTWSGSSMTWNVQVRFTTPITANHYAKILITYQYNDTATTQIKTIRIPIESTRTLLTTTMQTVGGIGAIPAITGGYLPETSVTVRECFLELWGNSGTAATTQFTLMARVNGTPTTGKDIWRAQPDPNSAPWVRGYLDLTGQAYLSGVTNLECLSLTTTSRFCTLGGMIVVTYEFNANTSTTIYNSLMLGAVDTSGWIGGTTVTDQGVWERNIYIEEPDTITLKESGLCLFQNDSAGYTFNIRTSGDTTQTVQTGYTAYVMTAGTIQCGSYSMVHRIDGLPGSTYRSPGMTTRRGKNLYRVLFYSNTAQAGWNLSGFLLFNYTSGKHPDGVGVHAHSVYQHVTDNITAGGSRVNTSVSAITPTIPETNYYLLGFLFWINYIVGNGTTGGLDIDFTASAEVVSTDSTQGGDGWVDLYNGTARSDSENQNGFIYAAARNNFTRWNGDTDPDRLNIKIGRKYRLSTGPLWAGSMGYWYTYNAITYTVSGVCSGFVGDGSGIALDIMRVNSATQDENILSTTTIAGGSFSTTWIDNTDTLYVVARENDTRVGRSSNGTAD